MIKDVSLVVTPEDSSIEERLLSIAKKKANANAITGYRIVHKSIDARRKDIKINITIRLFLDEDVRDIYSRMEFHDVSKSPSAIVVGAGPAGLFAALTLIENNVRPILIERGKDVHERAKDCANLARNGILDPESNYVFGEGGAGAFSDGKLYTRSVKRGDVKKVLSLFVQHGASDEILYDAHPHIGTDKLPRVIENIRNTIMLYGGEVHFKTKVVGLIRRGDDVVGVKCNDGKEFSGPVILATGHSAKDVYSFLDKERFLLEAKDIAVGVRVEHPQHLIDTIQYHNPEGRGKYLPPATYSFATQVENRGVYSFCMCPGGTIVPTSTEIGFQSVNGMSGSARLGRKANAAFVVQIRKEDLGENDNMAMLRYVESIERSSYIEGFKAPAQRLKDFVDNRYSQSLPDSTYKPGVVSANLSEVLSPLVSSSLREGFRKFDNMIRGRFAINDALVLASETRTSSPVRIVRDNGYKQCNGLFPAGEGSGYAGGIVSAAIDGTESAIALARSIYAK